MNLAVNSQDDKLPPQDNKSNSSISEFALIGFCCDEGIKRNLGRTGAAQGPDVLRNALAKIPVPQRNMIFYDAGNVVCENGDLESAQSVLGDCVSLLLNHSITPIVIGGGHELAYGHYQGIEKHLIQNHEKENLGIINFDAHFDMRPMLSENLGSSGTPFLQIAKSHEKTGRRFDYNCFGIQKMGNLVSLFETASNYHTKTFLAEDVHQNEIAKSISFLDRMIKENDSIYLSLCLDVFSSAYAPGVSAPQPLGLNPWQVIPLVRHLAKSNKVKSYDIAELSPKYDIDQHTTKLAASFVYEIISSHAR